MIMHNRPQMRITSGVIIAMAVGLMLWLFGIACWLGWLIFNGVGQ